MTTFGAFGGLIMMVAGTLGAGAGLLRALGISDGLPVAERPAWAFGLGFGVMGWAMFFLAWQGWLGIWPVALLFAAGLPGLRWLPRPPRAPALSAVALALLAAIALILAGDLLEALAPPLDADSLAYHFALPRRYLATGDLIFIERAVDAISPQLCQMTYLAALALGGERLMTLWCMASGWAAAAMIYGLVRRHASVSWALAAALAWLSLPAVQYGAGSGQVEARTAMFFIMAAGAAAEASHRGDRRWAVLAGLAVGFFIGAKYTGLVMSVMIGIALLPGRGWRGRSVAFALAALAAGGQWYVWNWAQTGDPLFPLLFGRIPYRDGITWNAAQQAYSVAVMGELMAVPKTLGWMIAYPLAATLTPTPLMEASRTGFGPIPLLLLPFALTEAWVRRRRVRHTPLALMAVLSLATYVLWFWLGPSQLVRHLLPVLPPLLAALFVSAAWICDRWPVPTRPLALGIAVALCLQLAGAAVFDAKYARFTLQGGDRDAFLARYTDFYPLVRWLNANIGPGEMAAIPHRHFDYLVHVPFMQAHHAFQSVVEVRQDLTDPIRFLAQLRRTGITHLVVGPFPADSPPQETGGFDGMAVALRRHGCASPYTQLTVPAPVTSRTLDDPTGRSGLEVDILRLEPRCSLD